MTEFLHFLGPAQQARMHRMALVRSLGALTAVIGGVILAALIT